MKIVSGDRQKIWLPTENESVESPAPGRQPLPEPSPRTGHKLQSEKFIRPSAPVCPSSSTASSAKPEGLRPRPWLKLSTARAAVILFFSLIILVAFPFVAITQPAQSGTGQTNTIKQQTKKVAQAQNLNPHAPSIDGKLDDPAWQHGEWYSDFVQFHPYEGREPTEKTAFKILHDESHLYIAIRCYDSKPETIERRLGRRDLTSGDYVMVFIDSLHDLRTSYCFAVNAAGVKADQILPDDSFDENSVDLSWDPIWEAKTALDEKGWTAEMKIPFSQLRFSTKGEQVWGLEVGRELFRNGEISLWQPIPKEAPGWTSQFGELRGMSGLKPPRQVEIMPYTVGRLRYYQAEPGNPFLTGKEKKIFGGLDGKIGLTHDLRLNFTLNPDFGQVEADPSEINLTAYETYFEEKRPFFVESQNITNYRITGGDGDFSFDNLFYSRRIGRAPQIYPETAGFCSVPQSTTILGAFKLSGKTRNGWSVGAMEALTSRESASTFNPDSGIYGQETVEPLTNYAAFRLSKDYREGATVIGTIFTAVNRNLDSKSEGLLHRSAYSGGFDLYHSWKDRQYYFSLKLVGSMVFGTEEALQQTQLSSVHYFNRPDVDYLTYDPSRRSLYGHGGSIDFGRTGGSRLVFSTGVTWRSPGLELNDMGFLRYADVAMQYFWAGYRFYKPFSIFRNLNLNINQWCGWNFGGERIFAGGNVNAWAQFKNYWSLSFGINRQFSGLSQSVTRGGPLLRVAPAMNIWSSVQTDSRKKLRLAVQAQWRQADNDDSLTFSLGPQITYVPVPAFNLSLRPAYRVFRSELQYVRILDFEAGKRYLVGKIDQKTLSLVVRFNLSLTPDLSLQFYGMPFISAGKYTRFKMITQARARNWSERYHLFGAGEISYDEAEAVYRVDENGDGLADYSFGNPDFNFRQFRSNLVLRWEYKPGCTLFLVWSQDRTSYGYSGLLDFDNDLSSLFSGRPDNVFLLKFSYNFNL
ncbi:MAG: DUF5916 domain-containing protein [Candidatus Saccharicenans sp.]|nr:DUF5916 domain-containing protein [Candidatus Saccharicenans sp.]